MESSMPNDLNDWPSEGLEQLRECVICGEHSCSALYQGLTDTVFGIAPGEWSLYRCQSCSCAYLNPRPAKEAIDLAYRDYYTSTRVPPTIVPQGSSLKKQISSIVKNSYLRSRFGCWVEDRLSSPLFFPDFWPFSQYHRKLDRWMRNLPSECKGLSLLDVGCGSGGFVMRAKKLGLDAKGIDPDIEAIRRGSEVVESLEVGALPNSTIPDNSYDMVTMDHVIEHLHNPVEVLRDIYRILKPGGRLWLATPNIDCHAHSVSGRDWLHLDPPRHLVIFNVKSLNVACEKAGFYDLKFCDDATAPYEKWELVMSSYKSRN